MFRHLPSSEEETREKQLLKELKAEKYLTRFSQNSLKRQRIPQIDLESHPFCQDRQLADEYQLLNYNKNPRLYSNSLSVTPRVERNYNNYSVLTNEKARPLIYIKNTSNTETSNKTEFTPRERPHFLASSASTTIERGLFIPEIAKSGNNEPSRGVVSLDYKNASNNYSHTTIKTATFGHRPESASRHYAPLTQEVAHRSRRTSRTRKRTGMSAMEMQMILTPQNPQHKAVARDVEEAEIVSRTKKVQSREKKQAAYKEELERLEKAFDSRMYQPEKHIRKGTSMLYEPDPDSSVSDILLKYQKLSVGDVSF